MSKNEIGMSDWTSEKVSMISTMANNIAADLLNGNYDPAGASITKSICELAKYVKEFASQHGTLCGQYRDDADNWCRIDILMRGVIGE